MIKAKGLIIVAGSLESGGAEKNLLVFVKYLIQKNFIPIKLVSLSGGTLIDEYRSLGIDPIILNTNSTKKAFLKIIRFVRSHNNYNVYGSISQINMLLAFLKYTNLITNRVIVRESSIASERNKRQRLPFIYSLVYRHLYNSLDCIICQSKIMSEDLIKNYRLRKSLINIVPNPIEEQVCQQKILFKKKRKKNSEFNVLFVGRFVQYKGIEKLKRLVSESNNRVWFYIFGNGPMKSDFCQFIERENYSKFVKTIDFDPNPFVFEKKKFDCLVILSDYEGFPNVALQAISYNIPVICLKGPNGLLDLIDCFPAIRFCNNEVSIVSEFENISDISPAEFYKAKNTILNKHNLTKSMSNLTKIVCKK